MKRLGGMLAGSLLLFSQAALAFTPNCLVTFGNLTAMRPEELTDFAVKTYRQLWETPHAARLSSELLRRTIETGDPFRVPEVEGEDSFALRGQLEQFQRMIEVTKIDTPALRGRFMTELTERLDAQRQAETKRAGQAHRIALDITLPDSEMTDLHPIPGTGDFLLLHAEGTGTPTRYRTRLINGQTGTITEWEPAPKLPLSLLFSSDGKFLYSFHGEDKDGYHIAQVPLTPHGPSWSKSKEFALPPSTFGLDTRIQIVSTGGKDTLLLGVDEETSPSHRLDPQTGTITPLKTIPCLRWRPLPGTDLISLVRSGRPPGLSVQLARVGEKGITLLPGAKKWAHSKDPRVEWENEKGPVVVYHEDRAELFLPGKRKPLPLLYVLPQARARIREAALHPDGKSAALLVVHSDAEKPDRIVWVDLATQIEIAHIKVPREQHLGRLRFAPDGRLLANDDKHRQKIFNLEARRNE